MLLIEIHPSGTIVPADAGPGQIKGSRNGGAGDTSPGGAGLHACPGSLLARMEAAVDWGALIARSRNVRLAASTGTLASGGWKRLDLCP